MATSNHQTTVGGKSASATVIGNGHVVTVKGDFSVYDVTAGKYVSVDQTTFGTTATPKNQ